MELKDTRSNLVELSTGQLMRVNNVARRLDTHRKTIIRMIERGDLEAIKLGAHWRVKLSSVEEYLKKGVLSTVATRLK